MKDVRTVSGDSRFLQHLIGNKGQFHLVGAYTATCEIEGISAAGLPGMLHYTPPADMEALYFGKAKCLPTMPEAPTGPPSPVILSLAVKHHFELPVSFVDAGLRVKSDAPVLDLDLSGSGSIMDGANVAVEQLLAAGSSYGKNHQCNKVFEIIAECVPGGTTTAYALCKGLGYACDHMFSGSAIDPKHSAYKRTKVNEAFERQGWFDDPMEVSRHYGDNMQPFVAAAAAEMSKHKPVVLAGGTQMLAVVALIKQLALDANFDNIAVMTTRWVVDDAGSDFKGLAELIDPGLNTFCSEFAMDSQISNLALYEQGMVKEGVGAGALLCYALANGDTPFGILRRVETIYEDLFG